MGKVMRIVSAGGSAAYWWRLSMDESDSEEEGSENLNLYVPSRPVVVVAAYEILSFSRRRMRKVDVHPAPRIRRSTFAGWVLVTSYPDCQYSSVSNI
jgi:hypothetical protein